MILNGKRDKWDKRDSVVERKEGDKGEKVGCSRDTIIRRACESR